MGLAVSKAGIGWALPLTAYLASKVYDLSVFCLTDPPADPGFTAADALHLLNVYNPVEFGPASEKMQQMVDRWFWYQVCQCHVGTTPAAPAAPAAPSGLPGIATPGACIDKTGSMTQHTSGTKNLIPDPSVGGTFDPVAGLQSLTIELTHTPAATGAHDDFEIFFTRCDDLTCTFGHTTQVSIILHQGEHRFWTPPIGATDLKYVFTSSSHGGGLTDDRVDAHLVGQCNGTPIGPGANGCCPPDTNIQAELDKILGLVTLIQRQIVPFGYVPGTVHTALTGHGVLSVTGLIGVKIDITTDPTTLGVEGNTPPILFDRGFFTWGTPDGYPQSERLERTHQLSLPNRASAFTDFAYDLHPGVEVTITELVREP